MDLEVFILLGTIALFAIDLILLSINRIDKRGNFIGLVVAVFGFALISVTYALLIQAFISDNFQLVGVYSASSSGASLVSKIYGSWASAGGSMLFLSFVLAGVYFGLRLLAYLKPNKFNKSTCQIFCIALLVFTSVTLLRNPFEQYAVIPIEGIGLNPSLQSFWMAIHPPIVFSAYAFIVLAYALMLSSVKTGKELDSSRLFKCSTYIAWILLTIGIALGGVWAYEVLGWGGYWAWDPVETASLLPWLLLTAYFILKAIPANKPSFIKEFMIMVTFASLVFLSALTRGGFTTSVHSYAASAMGPILLTFAIAMIGYFFYLKSRINLPLFRINVDKSSLMSRSILIGFWSLILISIVCLAGLAFPDFPYSYATFPFVLIFTASLLGFGLNEKTHYLRLLIIGAIAISIGLAASLIGLFNVNILTTFAFPLLLAAFFILLYGVIKALRQKSINQFGRAFLALAIIILLFGVFISAGAKTEITINNMKANTPTSAMQYNIQLSDLAINKSLTQVYSEKAGTIIPEYATLSAHIRVQQSTETYEGTLIASVYPNYGIMFRPLIISATSGDIYIHFEYTDLLYNDLVSTYNGTSIIPDSVSIKLQNNPMIYLVWAGVALMCFSMVIQLIGDLKTRNRNQSPKLD